jgi:hypothetical protein
MIIPGKLNLVQSQMFSPRCFNSNRHSWKLRDNYVRRATLQIERNLANCLSKITVFHQAKTYITGCKFSFVHVMKAYGWRVYTDPLTFNLENRWSWVGGFRPRSLQPPGKNLQYPLNNGLVKSQSGSGRYSEKKNLFLLLGIVPRILGLPYPSLPLHRLCNPGSSLVAKRYNSPVAGQEWPRWFQEVKVPRFHDNGTEWW